MISQPRLEKGVLHALPPAVWLYYRGPKTAGKRCLVSAARTTVLCRSVLAGGLEPGAGPRAVKRFIYVIFLSW